LILGDQEYFYLGRRFSKHRMTICAKNLRDPWRPAPPLDTPMCPGWITALYCHNCITDFISTPCITRKNSH